MKILIASDIHGSLSSVKQILAYYDEQKCDLLCLLGDLLNYGPRNGLPADLNPQAVADLLNERAEHIVAVRGNCDSEVDQMLLHFPLLADYALVVDGTRRLFLTHGHVYHEEHMPSLWGIDAFFYGHTHLPKVQPATDVLPLICNTGSPTVPKGGNPPTFAIYEDGKVELVVCK